MKPDLDIMFRRIMSIVRRMKPRALFVNYRRDIAMNLSKVAEDGMFVMDSTRLGYSCTPAAKSLRKSISKPLYALGMGISLILINQDLKDIAKREHEIRIRGMISPDIAANVSQSITAYMATTIGLLASARFWYISLPVFGVCASLYTVGRIPEAVCIYRAKAYLKDLEEESVNSQ